MSDIVPMPPLPTPAGGDVEVATVPGFFLAGMPNNHNDQGRLIVVGSTSLSDLRISPLVDEVYPVAGGPRPKARGWDVTCRTPRGAMIYGDDYREAIRALIDHLGGWQQ